MKQTLKWLTPKEAEKIPDGSVVMMRRVIHREYEYDCYRRFDQWVVRSREHFNSSETAMFLVIETPKKKGKK